MTKRILLTGGGSGGHFYPLMAIAEEIKVSDLGKNSELLYAGPSPYNASELLRLGISFIKTPARKRTKYFSFGNLLTPFVMLWGTLVAFNKLYWYYPDVVVSKGSYTSVPVTLAAALLRIPVIIHESDTLPGSANKLAARFARYIAIAYDDVAPFFPAEKTALVGIPLQRTFVTPQPNAAALMGIPIDLPIIFITGGSLGAESINELILNSLDELLPHYTIIHQTGANNETTVRQSAASLVKDANQLARYFVRGTLSPNEMNLAMSAAHLIISRAGSGTIFEIAAKGKPSIVIPVPESVSHDQRTNAYAYARSGAASVLEQDNLRDDLLASEIHRIMGDRSIYDQMAAAAKTFAKPEANRVLAETIVGVANEHQ